MTKYIKQSPRGRVMQSLPPDLKPIFKHMPEVTQAKVCMLHYDWTARQSELAARHDRREESVEARRYIRTAIGQFNRDVERGYKPSPAESAEHEQNVKYADEIEAEIKACNEPLPSIVTEDSIHEFLRDNKNAVWGHKATKYTGPATLASFANSVIGLDKLKLEKRRIRSAPLTLAEIDAKITADITRLGFSFDPKVERVARQQQDNRGNWVQQSISWNSNPEASSNAISGLQALGLVANLLGPQLIDAAKKRVRDGIDLDAAISAKDRAVQIAKLDERIMAAERLDEAIYLACREAGLVVARRPNARIEAILELEIDKDYEAAPAVPPTGATRGALQVAQPGDELEGDEIDEHEFG